MYKSKYRCSDCKYEFEKITKIFPRRDPSCPKCKQANKVRFKTSISDKTHNLNAESRVREVNESRRAPSYGGTNQRNKAIDETARIVMEDYKMTDVNIGSNLREGDNCVPKLTHEQEAKVDQVFSAKKPIMGHQAAGAINQTLMRQVNAGAFKSSGGANDVVTRQANSGYKPPVNVLFEHGR